MDILPGENPSGTMKPPLFWGLSWAHLKLTNSDNGTYLTSLPYIETSKTTVWNLILSFVNVKNAKKAQLSNQPVGRFTAAMAMITNTNPHKLDW